MARIAAAAVLTRHWPQGGRNDAALALAGGLLRADWSVEEVQQFIEAVAVAAQDEEAQKRVKAVAPTKEKLDKGALGVRLAEVEQDLDRRRVRRRGPALRLAEPAEAGEEIRGRRGRK